MKVQYLKTVLTDSFSLNYSPSSMDVQSRYGLYLYFTLVTYPWAY